MITVTEAPIGCQCFECKSNRDIRQIKFSIGPKFFLCKKCLQIFHEATHKSIHYNWEDDLK